jgi:hypothetical protein
MGESIGADGAAVVAENAITRKRRNVLDDKTLWRDVPGLGV